MTNLRVQLRLVFDTPPSVGAGGSTGMVAADKVVTRNAAGQYVIPGSQIKGKLRHACEQILRMQAGVPVCRAPRPEQMCPMAELDLGDRPDQRLCVLCQILGSPGERSRLRFHDLVADVEATVDATLRPMVSLNRKTRTAEDKRLFLVETAPYIRYLSFANTHAIVGHVDDMRHVQLILAGLKIVGAWGGGASRGLGWASAEARAWLGDVETPFDVETLRSLCQA
jgi:CRISPR/Cas system CSM-associated protein Csm3 (group 7 of RAMP superfamily)